MATLVSPPTSIISPLVTSSPLAFTPRRKRPDRRAIMRSPSSDVETRRAITAGEGGSENPQEVLRHGVTFDSDAKS